MNRTSAVILGLVVFLGLIAGPTSRNSAREASTVASGGAPPAETPSAAGSNIKTDQSCEVKPGTFKFDLIDMVRVEFSRGAADETQCPEKYHIYPMYRFDKDGKAQTHILFAMVPDPVHTNLSLLFDQQMDALQQGVLDSGWTFEKALMPWDNKAHPESSDFRIRLLQEQFEGEQEEQPGLMLFRRSQPAKSQAGADKHNEESKNARAAEPDGISRDQNETPTDSHGAPTERLFVFVIGESPADGVHKHQFRQALDLVEQFFLGRPAEANQQLPDISIVGPTFSGSLHSLAALLDCSVASAYPCTRIRVMSGTVTSQVAKVAFEKETGLPVVSLQENDEYVVRQFLYFACKTWRYQTREIAIISEDETAYGTAGIKTNAPMTASQNKSEGDACDDRLDDRNERQVLHLYFPRDILRLGSAYQRVVGGHSSGKGSTPRSTLPLDLDSNTTDEDTVREYSGKQLPLSQEATLLGIVGELQAHRSQIVLLRATSALDQLFLSRYLRQAYPDARIITVSADLLFAREIEDARLHGVMALTTYSLTAAADHEFHNDAQIHSDRVFPNTHAVGTYNAVKLILATAKLGQEECKSTDANRQCVHLFQYGWPMLSRRPHASVRMGHPPVHLTVLGHGGFWEVAVLPGTPEGGDKDDKAPRQKGIARSSLPSVEDPKDHVIDGNSSDQHKSDATSASDEALEEQQPQIWYVLWILAIGVSLVYAYFIWFPSILSSAQSVAQLAPPLRDSRRNLFALTALLHFSLLLAVFWPYWYLFKNAGRQWEIAGLLIAMTSVSIVGAADLKRRNCIRQRHILLGTFALMLIVLFMAWQPDYFHYMSVFRSVHLASGLSDLSSVLLLLCAGLWGAWYALSGSSLVDKRRTILPTLSLDSLGLSESHQQGLKRLRSILEEGQRQLRRLLNPAFIDKRALLLGAFFAVPVVGYSWGRPLRTLEPINHEYALTGLTLFLFLAIVVEVLRIRGIWTELRHLLIALDSVPLRNAFRKLTGFSWSPLWQLGGGNLGDFQRIISRQLEALRCAFALDTPLIKDIKGRFNHQLQNTLASLELLTAVKEHPNGWHERSNLQTEIEQGFKQVTRGHHYGSFPTNEAAEATATAPARSALQPTCVPKMSLLDRVKYRLFPYRIEREIALVNEFAQLQQEFARAGLHSLAFVMNEWDSSTEMPEDKAHPTSKQERNSPNQPETHLTESGDAMKQCAERFLALLYTNFIAIVLMRIRTLIVAVSGMYVFFVLALTTYPFQPELEIRFFLAVLLLFIIGVVGLVYAQMHRDTTLSHITNTEPGQLGSSFWLRIGSFVALPVFSLIASSYPEIGNTIYSLLEPALHALQ